MTFFIGIRGYKELHHIITVLEEFFFGPARREGQGVAFGVAEDEEAVGSEQLGEILVVEKALRERGGAAAHIFFTVGGVGEDEVEALAGSSELGDRDEGVLGANMQGFGRETGGVSVLAQEGCVLVREFNAEGGCSATAEALQAQSAGAGEKFQDACPLDPGSEAIEDGLLNEVGCGADIKTFGGFEEPPGMFAAGNAHGERLKPKAKG
jgi:hypothetical protein